MSKRMISAHAYPDETKEIVLRAVEHRKHHDIIVTDPLVLGSGAFDIQDLDETLIIKLTDATHKKWILFLERNGAKLTARDG